MKKRIAMMALVTAFALNAAACGKSESKDGSMKSSMSGSMKSDMKSGSEGMASDMKSGSTSMEGSADKMAEGEMLELTAEELAKFNGKDGEKAYIAIEGKIYDVTDLAPWKNGEHNGYEAGKDLTEEMKKAPHGLSKIQEMTPIGTLK